MTAYEVVHCNGALDFDLDRLDGRLVFLRMHPRAQEARGRGGVVKSAVHAARGYRRLFFWGQNRRPRAAAKAPWGALGAARVSGGALSLFVSQAPPLFPNLCTSSALSNL